MKILVIDDNPLHQRSAVQTLGSDHELTVVSGHDEALKYLSPYYKDNFSDEVERLLRDRGLPSDSMDAQKVFDPKTDPKGWQSWKEAKKQAELDVYHWDAVLSDLLMPAGRSKQGDVGKQYVGTEMPVGWALAIQAALNGAKYVAVATDMNHHDHPASAMLDGMIGSFNLHQARALFINHVLMIGLKDTATGECSECSEGVYTANKGSKHEWTRVCNYCGGHGLECTESGKHWGKVLEEVMGSEKE